MKAVATNIYPLSLQTATKIHAQYSVVCEYAVTNGNMCKLCRWKRVPKIA